MNFIGPELNVFPFPHGLFDISKIKNTLKSVSPENVKINKIVNCITIECVICIHATENVRLRFVERSFTKTFFGY